MADKTPDKSYGWTSAQNFNDYMEGVIGAYGEELEKMRFDDEMNSSLDETDYLDCVKFCADLIWHEYQVKQEEAHPRPDTALVNTDVLDTVLLSLHPAEVIAATEDVSERSRIGLAQLHRFYPIIKLEKVEKEEMRILMENLPEQYSAKLALMCWFVTLASKMTGKEIPGVGMAPGGKIVKPEEEVCEHLCKMLAIAEAMSSEGKWHLAQYYVLKEMLKDLRAMASEWCDQCAMCTSTTSEEKMEAELGEKSGDEVGKSFWQWGLKDMVAWWKGEEQKVEKADQELAEMDQAEKKELLERMAGAQVAGVGNAAGGHPSLDHHPAGHPSVGGSAGQDLLDQEESATVDAEMVKELHHAYRLGGHGAAAFALWWLEEGSSNTGFHFDQAAVVFTELPTEVKEEYLRRAILLMDRNPMDGAGATSSD